MHNVTNAIDLAGQTALVAVDFHRTRIFTMASEPHSRPETVTAEDPRDYYHNVYHRHGNPDGTYEGDSDAYWHLLTEALAPAAAILVIGHGTGKSNASDDLVDYMIKHRRDVADKVVGRETADLDDLTDEQLLRLGQHLLGKDPRRDHGDSERGA